MQETCLRMKDGKVLIARKGKPFFPEPLHKDVMVLNPDKETFLIGPYPKQNTMIMPLDQYHKMLLELKNNCPNAKSWRVAAMVFMAMFVVMVFIYFQQTIFSQSIFRHISKTWNKEKS